MDALSMEELNGLRMIMAVKLCGQRVLHKTFCWGTPDKPSNMKLDDYLKNLKKLNPKSSANYLKVSGKLRDFDKAQENLINMSVDGSMFDVSMLYHCIKLACENVASFNDLVWRDKSTEMEYYVTAIKDMRNDVLHGKHSFTDTEINEKTKELLDLLFNCLKTSRDRYKRDQDEVDREIKQITEDLKLITNKTFGVDDLVINIRDDLKELTIEKSSAILKDCFQKKCYLNPLSFIIKNLRLKVSEIFVDVEVKQGKRGEGESVDYKQLLKLVHNTAAYSTTSASLQQSLLTRPQVLLLEGLAGSGKTTLMKLITEEWIQGGQGMMEGLDYYELLLWVQCRDPIIKSPHGLLDMLMPDVSTNFKNLLLRVMKLCKLLIIVDSLDEINEQSEKLIKSLLHECQNSSHTTFLCASRPEKVEIFERMIPQEYDVTNIELQGITDQVMPQFVQRTHQEISKKTNSNHSTNKLVDVVIRLTSFQEHLRLPLNLTFFIYILNQKSENLNLLSLTETELYYEIHLMWQKKLKERLVIINPRFKEMSKRDLDYKVNNILREMYVVAVETFPHDQLTLENEMINRLCTVSSTQELPSQEVFSTFLCLKPITTKHSVKKQYSLPHKGLRDFYCALHIAMTLKEQFSALPSSFNQQPPESAQAPNSDSPAETLDPSVTIRGILEKTINVAIMDITKFQNIFVHVAELLRQLFDQVPKVITDEVVHLLRESGVMDNYHCLNLLETPSANSAT
ncbi:hypothetical protein OTU49_011199 [Cherax quadricarinatus]|uniref:NACHT domain-containing protein n=1 Tax=Cherax quadricarinatus TaxID=27406 RepID=A0AAW0W5S0_CHEQU